MQPLRYSINVTLDGCCDHRAGTPNERTHQHAADTIAAADALILGRTTYEMMEAGWRAAANGARQIADWMMPFARTIDAARKYVVSDTLDGADWNAEIIRPKDLEATVRQLKAQPGRGLYTGGLTLPRALAELGLIDEYEFVLHPMIAGHGPTLFSGLPQHLQLKPVSQIDLGSGIVATRYVPTGR